MNSFATGKLKEITALLQLLVDAMGCIDANNNINDTSIYDIVSSISSKDNTRVADIDGTLQEQIKALNDNLARTNELLDYIDDCIGHDADGTGYIRIMDNGNGWTWSYKESATQ